MAAAVEQILGEGWNVNNSDAVTSNDPDKIYKEWDYLRSNCPVAKVDRHCPDGYWLMTRYEDIKNCASDSDTFISRVHAVVPSDPRGIRRPPLTFDAPNHTPYKRALERTLNARRLKRLEVVLEECATEELQKLISRGEGNICTEFGALYSAWVECHWLNLEKDIAPGLATNAKLWVAAWRVQSWDDVKKYSEGFYDIARDLLADRRKNPKDPEEDPASSLLLERDAQGEPLEEFHLVGCLRQSLVVAMIAPTIFVGMSAKHLSEDKELQKKLRENPDLIPAAAEELFRLYTPYRSFARSAAHPVEISGQMVQPGEPLAMTYASANRDPEQFEHPDQFILNRENIASHLGFGRGRHRCAGMPLARLAMQIFIKVLLRDTEDFEVVGPLDHARMPEIGIISCPMTFVAKKE